MVSVGIWGATRRTTPRFTDGVASTKGALAAPQIRAMSSYAELPSCRAAELPTFRMFVFEGKNYDEIAQEQGIARATVGTRILRARLRLKQLLEARSAG